MNNTTTTAQETTTHYTAKAVGYAVIDVISEMPASSHIFDDLTDAQDYALMVGRNSNQPARYDVMTLWIHSCEVAAESITTTEEE